MSPSRTEDVAEDSLADALWSQAGVHRDGESVNIVDALFAIGRAIGSHGHAVMKLAAAIEKLAARERTP